MQFYMYDNQAKHTSQENIPYKQTKASLGRKQTMLKEKLVELHIAQSFSNSNTYFHIYC